MAFLRISMIINSYINNYSVEYFIPKILVLLLFSCPLSVLRLPIRIYTPAEFPILRNSIIIRHINVSLSSIVRSVRIIFISIFKIISIFSGISLILLILLSWINLLSLIILSFLNSLFTINVILEIILHRIRLSK